MDYCKTISSPVGMLTLIVENEKLTRILWEGQLPENELPAVRDDHPLLLQASLQLHEYFSGKRKSFDIEPDLHGTEFQKKVWKAMLDIPFGKTKTYGEIAVRIGIPGSVRAVGGAANKNPVPVIVPCHRVIGANGSLTGFGGGLERKLILLEIEGRQKIPALWDTIIPL